MATFTARAFAAGVDIFQQDIPLNEGARRQGDKLISDCTTNEPIARPQRPTDKQVRLISKRGNDSIALWGGRSFSARGSYLVTWLSRRAKRTSAYINVVV